MERIKEATKRKEPRVGLLRLLMVIKGFGKAKAMNH